MEKQKSLSPCELAERWDMAEKTLMNWRGTGKGPPYVKIGRRVLYPERDVEAYEQAHRITPAR